MLFKGNTGFESGAPSLHAATAEEIEDDTLPEPKLLTLAEIVAEPLKYFGQLITIKSLVVSEYDNRGNATFRDSEGNTICEDGMSIATDLFPVNCIVDVTFVLGYDDINYMLGNKDGIVLATATAIKSVSGTATAIKSIVNGQLVIERNGVQYNAAGQEVK